MKILFIGMGSIGKRHYECLSKIKDTYNLEFASYKTNKNSYNSSDKICDVNYFYDLEEAFSYKPDCAIISNPTSNHVESVIECVERGINVFIEKPLSNSFDNIDKITKIVDNKNIITLMGCNLRFHPALVRLKELVHNKALGEIYDFSIEVGSYLPEWRPWQNYSEGYSAKKELGGGVVLDLIHEIDYANWIFGDFIDIKSYCGKVSNLHIETEDLCKIILKTSKGIYGDISLNYYRRVPKRIISVNCEKGTFELDLIQGILNIQSNDNQNQEKFHIEKNYTYENQMEYFIKCIMDKKKTSNDIYQGIKVLKYALEIKKEK